MNKILERSRITIIAVIAMAFIISCISSVSATTINVTAKGDISYVNQQINGTLNQSTYLGTFYLPCTLSQVNSTGYGWINITAGTKPATLILTVNNVKINSGANYTLPASSVYAVSFAVLDSKGVDMSSTTLNINLTILKNETIRTNLTIVADDAVLSGNNVTISVTENKIKRPKVKFDKDNSKYSVKDTVSISQNSDFNLTGVNLTFTYPSYAVSQPISSYSAGNLYNNSSAITYTISYQKKGPYIKDISASTGTEKITTEMDIYSYESLRADFTFDPTEDPWADYFPNFNENQIDKIKLNNKEIDWETGSIVLSKIKLDKGPNTLEVIYASVPPPSIVPVEPTPWYIENWYYISIAVAAILIIIYLNRRRL